MPTRSKAARNASTRVDSAARCFLDTNVLLYCFDERDTVKQQRALDLVDTLGRQRRAMVSTQVLIELFQNLTRKFQAPPRAAAQTVAAFAHWPVVESDQALVHSAMNRCAAQSMSIFDAMIVEAALRCGADCLLSEDLNAGERIGSLQLVNPFAEK